MKILKWVIIVMVVLVLAFVVVGLMLPSKYEISRTATFNATPEQVHAVIGDLKQWPKWGSWWRTFTDMKATEEGDGTSVGSKLTWTHEKAGNGSIEILKSDPKAGVWTVVKFKDGDGEEMAMNSDLLYVVDGATTKVTWKGHGDAGGNLIHKMMASFLFDSMMGPDFEKGLKNAKELVESGAKP